MRGNNTKNVGDIIRKLMKNPKLSKKMDELDVLEIFQKLIGKQLQKYITDARMKEGTLLVKIKSAPLRNELSYRKSEITERINAQIGKEIVKEIILK